jgi:hypothetical protein
MRNLIRIFTIVMLLFICTTQVQAQSFYTEYGVNILAKMDYQSSESLRSESTSSSIPQKHFELGLKYPLTSRLHLSLGLSSNAYRFENRLYFGELELDGEAKTRYTNSLFELDFMGANMGLEWDLIERGGLRLYTSGKISYNSMNRGTRTDQVMNFSEDNFSNLDPNLMHDESFKKLWYNLQFGFGLSYKLNSFMDFYTQYHFNSPLSSVKTENTNYDFSAYDVSLGFLFNISKKLRCYQMSSVPNPLTPLLNISHAEKDKSSDLSEQSGLLNTSSFAIEYPYLSLPFDRNENPFPEEQAALLSEDSTIRQTVMGYYPTLKKKLRLRNLNPSEIYSEKEGFQINKS